MIITFEPSGECIRMSRVVIDSTAFKVKMRQVGACSSDDTNLIKSKHNLNLSYQRFPTMA